MTQPSLPGLAPAAPPQRPKRITATPAETHCPTCGARTIAAWADRLYEDVHTDPVRLTALGELQALAAGRRTFEHWSEGLDQRHADAITRRPAGPDGDPVRPEHACGHPPPDHLPPPPRVDPDPDRTPF